MPFGIYVHIPFCLQLCSYCDFATQLQKNSNEHEDYLKLLFLELESRSHRIGSKKLSSIYFGGGTPSLLGPKNILALLNKIAMHGFSFDANCEISLEINPDTVSKHDLKAYLDMGVNRFSVGVQTFNDDILKKLGRLHSAKQSIQSLEILAENNVNFNFDILFALPEQNMKDLQFDLELALKFKSSHLSAYCLTIPERHKLQLGRPDEEAQVEMFLWIRRFLQEQGFEAYEISNFCKPGMHSRHNLNAWLGHPYWGIGLSAHSYLKAPVPSRFSNPNSMIAYQKQMLTSNSLYLESKEYDFLASLPETQLEILKTHEQLTDYCHTHLRIQQGINKNNFLENFDAALWPKTESRLIDLIKKDYICLEKETYRLSEKGILLSNQVFSYMLFSKDEL